MTADYYALLSVVPDAEDEIIRAAYLVLRSHTSDTATAAFDMTSRNSNSLQKRTKYWRSKPPDAIQQAFPAESGFWLSVRNSSRPAVGQENRLSENRASGFRKRQGIEERALVRCVTLCSSRSEGSRWLPLCSD